MTSKQDFLKISGKLEAIWGRKFYKHIDFCGLQPVIESNYGYNSTPVNSVTFASTGGEGVHFGLLTDERLGERKPVVMTVPMVSKNIVLADNLDEFFGLGFYNGWFTLEQLVYGFEETINYYSTEDLSVSLEQKNFLELMRKEFKIRHVPLTKERLENLAIDYHKILVLK